MDRVEFAGSMREMGAHMSDDHTPAAGDGAIGPDVRPPIGRRRVVRRIGVIAAVSLATVAAVAAAAVIAARGGEARADAAGGGGDGAAHAHSGATAPASGDGAGGPGIADRRAGPGHDHEPLPPYEQRYADATDGERQAADDLLDEVRSTLAAYADVDAAVAAGYQAPRRPRSQKLHYQDRSVASDGIVLDPSRPNGLVYDTVGGGEPVLLGAYFLAPPGAAVPSDAGDLVVWHSHDPSCPAFFATADAACADTRRMLHVWAADQLELVGSRGQLADVEVVDPFGTPLRASVAPVG
jgi:hypothetical protein